MEKSVSVLGIDTVYMEDGTGDPMVLMHGWGQNKEMMQAVFDHFKDRYHVIALDFPGFGKTRAADTVWGVEDYEKHFAAFVDLLGLKNVTLVAHSFGCRVAIRYAADHGGNVKTMVLTGAAGIRAKQSLKAKLNVLAFKIGKWFLLHTDNQAKLEALQKVSGSADYQAAQGIMRPTFVKVVNDDVTPVLPQVKCPVLLVWGDQDTAVPLWMGKQMEKDMADASLVVFAGDDHWAYWHQADRFNSVMDAFLTGVGNG